MLCVVIFQFFSKSITYSKELNEGIDVSILVNDGLPLAKPLIGLEYYPCMLDVTRIPTSITRVVTERIPLDTNMTITEEVQQACEMLEEVKGQVEVSTSRGPTEPEQPNVELDLERPNIELDHVDNVTVLQGACVPLYEGAQCL